MLTYTVISDWANDVFTLNPQTGVFTLTARLDYEEVWNISIYVYGNKFLKRKSCLLCSKSEKKRKELEEIRI